MVQPLIAPTFLFRFAAPCRYAQNIWRKDGIELSEEYRLPSFGGELEGRPLLADVRAAWNEKGLSFTVRVVGKKQAPWCRPTRLDDSDGLSLWIDTRATHNIHRASRFCHRFLVLPFGGGRDGTQPIAQLALINRAKENPKIIPAGSLPVTSETRVDGYLLNLHLPAKALTGFDPEEHRRLGFMYAVNDRELGSQTFSIGSEFPYHDDPSLWGDLDLERE